MRNLPIWQNIHWEAEKEIVQKLQNVDGVELSWVETNELIRELNSTYRKRYKLEQQIKKKNDHLNKIRDAKEAVNAEIAELDNLRAISLGSDRGDALASISADDYSEKFEGIENYIDNKMSDGESLSAAVQELEGYVTQNRPEIITNMLSNDNKYYTAFLAATRRKEGAVAVEQKHIKEFNDLMEEADDGSGEFSNYLAAYQKAMKTIKEGNEVDALEVAHGIRVVDGRETHVGDTDTWSAVQKAHVIINTIESKMMELDTAATKRDLLEYNNVNAINDVIWKKTRIEPAAQMAEERIKKQLLDNINKGLAPEKVEALEEGGEWDEWMKNSFKIKGNNIQNTINELDILERSLETDYEEVELQREALDGLITIKI